MGVYQKIMVGLDFTEMDQDLIRYTSFLSSFLQPQQIFFIHIQKKLELPPALEKSYPDWDANADLVEQLLGNMQAVVQENFAEMNLYNCEFQVIEGSPQTEILMQVNQQEIDLLIVGRKQEMAGSGIVPKQIARKVGCDTLFVPESPKLSLKNIRIALDFSEYSKQAMQKAIAIGSQDPTITVISQHVYSVPPRYYKTGHTESEFEQLMHSYAKEEYESFLEGIDHEGANLDIEYLYDPQKKSPAIQLNNRAHEAPTDLIIVGAKGRTTFTAFLLGSVAEKLIQIDSDIPLLVVKTSREAYSLAKFFENPL